MHLRRRESAVCFEMSKTEGHMSKARKQISSNSPAWEQWGQIPRCPAQSCPVHYAWTLSVRCCGHSNPTHRVGSTSQEQTSRANGMARQVRVLAAKPDNLSSSLRAHMAEGKSWFLWPGLWSLHEQAVNKQFKVFKHQLHQWIQRTGAEAAVHLDVATNSTK